MKSGTILGGAVKFLLNGNMDVLKVLSGKPCSLYSPTSNVFHSLGRPAKPERRLRLRGTRELQLSRRYGHHDNRQGSYPAQVWGDTFTLICLVSLRVFIRGHGAAMVCYDVAKSSWGSQWLSGRCFLGVFYVIVNSWCLLIGCFLIKIKNWCFLLRYFF